MQKYTDDELCTLAAEWWADKVCGFNPHKHKMAGPNPTLQDRETEAFMNLVTSLGDLDSPRIDRDAFSLALKDAFVAEMAKRGKVDTYVDYDPDYLLGKVGDRFGIRFGQWPCKTGLTIENGRIRTKEGYAALWTEM